jgi:hypothetical protein
VLATLTLISGAAWTIAYIAAIRIGLVQRTYAIPSAALALNLAWESLYAGRGLIDGPSLQVVINIVWFGADIVIAYTFFRFGRGEFPAFVTRGIFIGWGVGIILVAYAVQGLFVVQFGWNSAQEYTAFLQNALMSGLFIAMFVARRGSRGQSVVLAVAKWIGTLAATIISAILGIPFLVGLGIICSVFDLAYIALLTTGTGRTVGL